MFWRGSAAYLLVCLATLLHANDWPTAAHDAARSGRTVDTASGPYRVRWAKAWQYENIATVSQLIVAQGRGYIGTLGSDGSFAGRIHCVDVQTGDDLWTYRDIVGGIAHSLTWSPHAGGTVYAATTYGEVVALDAGTGKLRWKFVTPLGGFVVNPCVSDGAVLLGSRQGVFYALNETDGTVRWQRDVDLPICNTAAAADGVVYFLDEGIITHAINIADGKNATGWIVKQLHGGAARFYWPVIVGEHVLFTVAPPHQYNWGQTDAVLFDVPRARDRKADRFAIGRLEQERAEQQNIIDFLTEHPHNQVMHCLRRSDGRPACIPGVLYIGGSGSECAPPVVTADNRVLVEYRSFYSLWDSDSWHNPYSALGELNPKTGIVTQLRPQLVDNNRLPWGHIWIIADESSSFSMAGETLLVAHQGNFGGFDLHTKRTFAGVGKRDTYGGYPPLSWNRQEWHGGPRSPLTIVDGTIYYIVGGRVIACESHAQPGAKHAEVQVVASDRKAAKLTIPEQFKTFDLDDLEHLLQVERTRKLEFNAAATVALRAALEKHIATFIDDTPLGMYHQWRGISPSNDDLFTKVDDVYALALAYPYVNERLQTRIYARLRVLINEEEVLVDSKAARPSDDRWRNFHREDRAERLTTNPSGQFDNDHSALYAASTVHKYLEPDQRKELFAEAIIRIGAASKLGSDELSKVKEICQLHLKRIGAGNSYLKTGQDGNYNNNLKLLTKDLLKYRVLHRAVAESCLRNLDAVPGASHDNSAGGQFRNHGGPYLGKTHDAAIVYWTDLSPEVGQFLREFAPQETAAIKRWMLRNAQGNYLVRWDTPVQEGEVAAPWYTSTMNYYHLLATVDQPDFTTMKLLVDMPACYGDVYYIERLVRAIESADRVGD